MQPATLCAVVARLVAIVVHSALRPPRSGGRKIGQSPGANAPRQRERLRDGWNKENRNDPVEAVLGARQGRRIIDAAEAAAKFPTSLVLA
jgi:hypothetical protein